ncbi:DUF2851 family protein [Flagellimonas pacifica]|uniref:DUF2851 family protein n=1 Tax=Flagellimonas pacifica TaxID=1247520 RepID=A0A285MXS3_9FLAO|nr:DUF2851 family protein [Allomuricauda parva]SNZ01982.1 Protein of unknown function [Allomuricauda parva]
MKEDLLHFIWRCDKLQGRPLTTSTSEHIVIKNPGTLNLFSGPDFFNARVEVGGQLWAGNVEMHLKSSDWYAHHHETDSNYDNVILHVVWEDDVLIFRKDGTQIPTLELKNYISKTVLQKYQELFQYFKPTFINCEKDFAQLDSFLVNNFLERLYVERLEYKSKLIFDLLRKSDNDWERVLFVMLMKNFGSKVNGEFFLQRASQLNFSEFRKTSADIYQLESLLFGHLGLLKGTDCNDVYYLELQNEYDYLSKKFDLKLASEKPGYFGLRPINFLTIRISQLANLYHRHQNLFAKLLKTNRPEEIYDIFKTETSLYWENHFTFGKVSKKSKKRLSKSFIDLLIINTIIPLRFCYAKQVGVDWTDELLLLISKLGPEKNSILQGFKDLGSSTGNALESQAKIQLYNNYCSKNKCLHCTLGAHLLNRNT